MEHLLEYYNFLNEMTPQNNDLGYTFENWKKRS